MGDALTTTELDIPVTGDWGDWTAPQRALCEFMGLVVKNDQNQMVPAPASVRTAFLYEVQRTGLDPMAHQIYAAVIGGKWTIMVGINGLRLIAQRSGEYAGQEPPLWTDGTQREVIEPILLPDGTPLTLNGEVQVNRRMEFVWRELWTETTPPYAAMVEVHRAGFVKPVRGIARWAAYGAGKKNRWTIDGPHMLAKCAESIALHKGFPMETSGLYIPEEFEQATRSDETGRDWENEAEGTKTTDELVTLYNELKASGDWTPNLDAKFRARKGSLAAQEANEEPAVIVVDENA